MEYYIGQLMLFAGNFAPKNWAFCNGQLMSIAQNSALFSIIGTTYGGDGITTFALPDLRGRVPIHFGQGPGLSDYSLGEVSGFETVTLVNSEMPQHNHAITANSGTGNTNTPDNANLAGYGTPMPPEGPYTTDAANTTLSVTALAPSGGSMPHENRPPYLTLNWIIALYGVYPSRG